MLISKVFGIFATVVLFAIVVKIEAATLQVPFEYEADSIDEANFRLENQATELKHVSRQKRATCDLLAFLPVGGSPACAAGCIARGFRGGYCDEKKVCRCRK